MLAMVILVGVTGSLTSRISAAPLSVSLGVNIAPGTCSVGLNGGQHATLNLMAPLPSVLAVRTNGGEVTGLRVPVTLEVDCDPLMVAQALELRVESAALAAGDNTLAYDSANSAVNMGLGVSLKGRDNPAGAERYYELGATGAPAVIKVWPKGTLPSAAGNLVPLTLHLRRADVTQTPAVRTGFALATLVFTAQVR